MLLHSQRLFEWEKEPKKLTVKEEDVDETLADEVDVELGLGDGQGLEDGEGRMIVSIDQQTINQFGTRKASMMTRITRW